MAESLAEAVRYKAREAFLAGDYGEALEKFSVAAEMSQHPADQSWRGLILQLLGRYADACEVYEAILREEPERDFALYHLALIKAACPIASLRDGKGAVELARHACEISGWKSRLYVGGLAAAHAELQEWEHAENFAAMALELAPESEKARCQERLEQYRSRQPLRSSPESDRARLVRLRCDHAL